MTTAELTAAMAAVSTDEDRASVAKTYADSALGLVTLDPGALEGERLTGYDMAKGDLSTKVEEIRIEMAK